jgi:CDP-diacylglycerol--serine O-phosphatidyltransferase
MYVVCGALRLARFNVQATSADKSRFVGLPIPAAAGVIAGLVLAYSYFEFEWSRTLTAFSVPLTLTLAGLMISRVPYPSFKSIHFHHRAPLETLVAILVAVGFIIALPQLMAFLLATSYLLSGPILLLKGERMSTGGPVLRPVGVEKSAVEHSTNNNSKHTNVLTTHPLRQPD